MRIRIISVLCLSLGLTAGAAAQEASPYTFRLIMGEDTIASDVVQRTAEGVEIDLISTTAGIRSSMTITVAPDERVRAVTIANYRLGPGDTTAVQTFGMQLTGDSVQAERTMPGRGTQRVAVPSMEGAVVYVEPSSALVEQVVRRARALGGERVSVPVLDLQTLRTAVAVVTWVAEDAAEIVYGERELHVTVGDDGSLIGYTVPALDAHAIRLDGAHPLVIGEGDA